MDKYFQKGFSAIILILIVLIISAVIAGGSILLKINHPFFRGGDVSESVLSCSPSSKQGSPSSKQGGVSDNFPLIPNANIKYHVPNQEEVVTFVVDYIYPNEPNYNISFNSYQDGPDGCLYIPPQPEDEVMTIRVTAQTEKGAKSEPLSFTNKEWMIRVYSAGLLGRDYAIEHTFVIK